MKTTLAAGIAAKRKYRIDRERTIDFMGEKARVYATPMLVRDIEVTCREFLLEHLDPGEDSVGTRVEIDHLAATLLGMDVEISVSVAEVKGRAVTFAVEAHDGIDKICRASTALRHRREADRGAPRRQGAESAGAGEDRVKVKTYCYQCVAGPDLLEVEVAGRRRHAGDAELRRRGHPSRRRQGLRQGLRPGAEALQPEPGALADEAHQPEEGARRRSRASCR